MHVEPMKSESCSELTLQDFTRKHGVPHTIKTDDVRIETGTKWMEHCRRLHAKQKHAEPHSPWKNYAEHGINCLRVMVRRAIRQCSMPCTQHHWDKHWCVEIRNVLASKKLMWRSLHEVWRECTLDISKFRFHIWEPM